MATETLAPEPLRMATADPTGLLNRYALPKVAMATIALAAALGCVLTVAVDAGMGYADAAAAYVLIMAAGTAAGGLFWHWRVVGPAQRAVADAGAEAYAGRQVALFHRLEAWTWPAAAVALAWLVPAYAGAGGASQPGEGAGLAAAALCLVAWGATALRRRRSPADPAQAAWSLVPAAGLLLCAAFLQVWHDEPGAWQLLLWRCLHLLAFAAWFGGAVWNVAIAVRAARQGLSRSVILAAHLQLERFRRVVRLALPLVLATGLLQVDGLVDGRWAAAVSGAFGHLILAKAGLIVLLVVIFNTCPMWHACSPIAGMCDIADLPRDRAREAAQVVDAGR